LFSEPVLAGSPRFGPNGTEQEESNAKLSRARSVGASARSGYSVVQLRRRTHSQQPQRREEETPWLKCHFFARQSAPLRWHCLFRTTFDRSPARLMRPSTRTMNA